MTTPVDLTNLREMTDGDKALEQALFEEFYNSGNECISTLEKSCAENDNEGWRRTAHAFKGTSLNLGANHLGELCKKAQDSSEVPQAEKTAMLAAIKAAFEDVKKFLATQ